MNEAKSTDGDSGLRFRFADQTIITLWQKSKQKDEGHSLCENENLRNFNCRHYEACLDTAARTNARDLGCEHCLFKTDITYKMTEGDLEGLLRLYRAIKA
jgi:hypothetical protein